MKQVHPQSRRLALLVWLLGIAMCCVVIARTTFITDLSGFLPQSPTKEQQVLLDQLREGVVSRLILIGIEGGDVALRAALSKETAKRLRSEPAFVTVNNGEPLNAERDQAFLFGNRYLLSPAVTPDRFSVAGLHAAIGDTIDLLVSPAGLLIKPLLPRDPTGEIVQLLAQMNGVNQPQMQQGAWASRDAARALLLVQTRATGADTDAQQQAMQLLPLVEELRDCMNATPWPEDGAVQFSWALAGLLHVNLDKLGKKTLPSIVPDARKFALYPEKELHGVIKLH